MNHQEKLHRSPIIKLIFFTIAALFIIGVIAAFVLNQRIETIREEIESTELESSALPSNP